MAVVFYQTFIIATIAIAYLVFGGRLGLVAAVLWTVWSVVMIFMPHLMIVQLFFVWGTYFLLRTIVGQRKKIRGLEDVLGDYEAKTRETIAKSSETATIKAISGNEHLKVLKQAFREAAATICITSGWLSAGLVTEEFSKQIKGALKRGIMCYIVFGWEDSTGTHVPNESGEIARGRLEEIAKASQLGSGKLRIARKPVHEKFLVVDQKYTVCGSNNWLSNYGFRNTERSYQVFSTDLSAEERDRIIKMATS